MYLFNEIISAERPEYPLVSVLIPAFNAESYIERTLDSVLSQTYRNLDIIVVDDGSTDRTALIVDAMVRKDPRIRLLKQPNAGVAAARNWAIRNARGALIAPLDADDLWHPDKIGEQVAAMLAAPETVGVVYCWSLEIDDGDRIIGQEAAWARPDYEGNVYAPLVVSNFLGNASVPLIRRSCLARVGGYDSDLRRSRAQGCEDWKLYLGLAEITDFALVRRVLVGYRQHGHSMSRDVRQMARSQRHVRAWIVARRPSLPRRLLRWQEAAFSIYYARQLRRSGYLTIASLWLARAAANDPLLTGTTLRFHLSRALLAQYYRWLAWSDGVKMMVHGNERMIPGAVPGFGFPGASADPRRSPPGPLAYRILTRRRALLSSVRC